MTTSGEIRTASGSAWRLTEGALRQWLEQLIEQINVVAPVEKGGQRFFEPITSPEDGSLETGKTAWSPKEFLFPKTENLYSYRTRGDRVQIEDPQNDSGPLILLGARACDAAGLLRLDAIFLGERRDELYAQRRNHTTVVALACSRPDPECFCTAVGVSPVGTEGCDAQLVRLEDGDWLLRPFTAAGEALAAEPGEGWDTATDGDLAATEAIGRQVAEEIHRQPLSQQWGSELEESFDHPIWQRLAATCLGCSICASVCPSCSCFDMFHEGNAWGGKQTRSWDGCTFSLFTQHASGHNPRSSRGDRFRQRVLHKFAFRSPEEPFRCVGCGRCLNLCPAGLDIYQTVRQVVESRAGTGP